MIHIKNHYNQLNIMIFIDYLLLFMMGIRLFNRNNTFMLLFVLLSLFLIIYIKRNLYFSIEGCLLAIFGVAYCLIGGYTTDLTSIFSNGIGAVLMYLVGFNILGIEKDSARQEKMYERFVYVFMFANFAFIALSYIRYGVTLEIDTQYAIDNRYVGDFWTGELFYCTNFNAYGVLICVLGIFILLQKYTTKFKIFTLLCVLFAIYISAMTASRTNIYLFIISIPIYILLYWWYKRRLDKGKRRLLKKEKYKRYGFIIVVLLIMALAFILAGDLLWDYLPIENFLLRFSTRDSGISNDSRWTFWSEVIALIPEYPFGGMLHSWAHNLYFDIVIIAGVFPALICLLFTISATFTSFAVFKQKNRGEKVRILAPLSMIMLLVSFMIEPVMEAQPYVFMAYCLFAGMNCYLKHTKQCGTKTLARLK